MNKTNPNNIKQSFTKQVKDLELFFYRVSTQIKGTPNEKRDLSQLAENVFLSTSVAYEGAVSDLFLAYINRDPSNFQAHHENRIRQSIKSNFGEWEDRIQVVNNKHMTLTQISDLLDSKGRNLTFKDVAEMREKSKQLLSEEFSYKIKSLTKEDEKVVDTTKAIRNYIAHRSPSSHKYMNDMLLDMKGLANKGLSRSQNEVNTAGAYLRAFVSDKRRVEIYMERLVQISNKL